MTDEELQEMIDEADRDGEAAVSQLLSSLLPLAGLWQPYLPPPPHAWLILIGE